MKNGVVLFASFFAFFLALIFLFLFAVFVVFVVVNGAVGVLEYAAKGLYVEVGFRCFFVSKLDDVASVVCSMFGYEVGCVEKFPR